MRAHPSQGRPSGPLAPAHSPAAIEAPSKRVAARRALALPDASLLATCQEAFFVASGPGGQHRNKTESGVRLVHPGTGLVVTATERRSQAQNRQAALARLRARLGDLAREPKVRRKTSATRGAHERRLAEKRRRSERKADRRGGGD